jgi:uncharacterized protein (TIRG00374 family)
VSLKRWLITIISFAAAVGVSVYIAFTSWPSRRAPAPLPLTGHLLALLAVLLEIAFRSAKITLSGAAVRTRIPFGTAVRTTLGGDFGAAITPARSGAEPARFLVLNEAKIPTAAALIVLYAELFLEALSLGIVALVLFVIFRDAGRMLTGMVSLVGGYAAFVLGAGVIGAFLARRDATDIPPLWARRLRITGKRWLAVQRALTQLRTSLDALRHARFGYAALALVASVLHVAMRVTILPILVYSFSVQAPLAPLVLWPLALMYGGVVAPAPGGGGFIEVAYRAALGGAIPARIFSATLIWWRFYTFYLYVIFGALAAGRTVMRALRETDAKTTAETLASVDSEA